jgi:hypothetical protein
MNREREAAGTSPRERGRYYHPIQKDYATFLRTSEETGGEYTLIEVEVAPGGGTPPHYHKTYDEHFEVLEGTLEVLLGKEKAHPATWTEARSLRKTHGIASITRPEKPTTFLVELRPGKVGFEKAVKAGYGLGGRRTRPPHRRHREEPLPPVGAAGVVGDPIVRVFTASRLCSGCWPGVPAGKASTGT